MIDSLKACFAAQNDIELAFLIGSQANGTAHAQSDWDFAIRWHRHVLAWDKLAQTEQLRHTLGQHLDCIDTKVDLVDILSAGLAMRGKIANEGAILKGENTL